MISAFVGILCIAIDLPREIIKHSYESNELAEFDDEYTPRILIKILALTYCESLNSEVLRMKEIEKERGECKNLIRFRCYILYLLLDCQTVLKAG